MSKKPLSIYMRNKPTNWMWLPIQEKKCSCCETTKKLTEYNKCKRVPDGYSNTCKKCVTKKYYWDDYENIKQKREQNKEVLRKKAKEYRKSERGKKVWKEANRRNYKKNKEKYRADYAKWKAENPNWHRDYFRNRYKNDPVYKLVERMRGRIKHVLKKGGNIKCATTLELLGADPDIAREHLENLFEEGMTWDNHGEWHIDHIIPCASFDLSDPEQQKKCFHYTNLQPLWASDNIKKSSIYEGVKYYC